MVTFPDPAADEHRGLLGSDGARRALAMRFAAVLFVGAGLLAFVSLPTVPLGAARSLTAGIGALAIAVGTLTWFAPWRRWPTASAFWPAPLALVLIAVANTVGSHEPYDYAVFYVIVHVWVGVAMPRYCSLALAPITAVAYTIPLTVIAADEGTALASTLVVVPACALIGEGISWLIRALDSSEGVRRELAQALARLEFTALHDAVTELPNRVSFSEHLEIAIARARRSGERLVVCSLDLDKFKLVNDTLGHGAGDALLRETAGRLSSAVREGDVVARVGGDEFLVLLPASRPWGHPSDLGDVDAIVDRIREALDTPVQLGDVEVWLGASVGTAVFPIDASDAVGLVKVADAKMYRHKRERSSIGIVEDARPELDDELELSTRLRRTAKHHGWTLRYQPIVELVLGRVVGAESLVRWHDPAHGLRTPSEFLTLVEELDLGAEMTRSTLGALAEASRLWAEDGVLDSLTMLAMNLSPRELWHPTLATEIGRLAEALGRRDLLVLEVTEAAVAMDVSRAAEVLSACRRAGARIALDDFGTGYSSLSRLRSLPIDIVKVDRSFIDGAERDPSSRNLLRSVTRLISGLEMVPVAEGVETERQLEIVIEEGFPLAQGFLFGPPVNAERFSLEVREAPPRVAVPPVADFRLAADLEGVPRR